MYKLCDLRVPFNWKSPFGYLIALSLEAISAFYTTTFCVSGLGFFIAFCWILLAFAKDIRFKLITLNKYCRDADRNDLKFVRRLYQLIRMHQNGRQ